MNISLPSSNLKELIKATTAMLKASELGAEAMKLDNPVACVLTSSIEKGTLKGEVQFRGYDVRVTVNADEITEEGTINLDLGRLSKLSSNTGAVATLEVDDKDRIKITMGRFVGHLNQADDRGNRELFKNEEDPSKIQTATFNCASLRRLVQLCAVRDEADTQEFVRVVWDSKGLRGWTHNSFNAALAVSPQTPVREEARFDAILPISLINAAITAGAADTITVGYSEKYIRLTTGPIQVRHPNKRVQIQDLDALMDVRKDESIAKINVKPQDFIGGLQSLGMIDNEEATDRATPVDIWYIPAPKYQIKMLLSTKNGSTMNSMEAKGSDSIEDPINIKVNYKPLLSFISSLKNDTLTLSYSSDRVMIWGTDALYVLATLQESV